MPCWSATAALLGLVAALTLSMLSLIPTAIWLILLARAFHRTSREPSTMPSRAG